MTDLEKLEYRIYEISYKHKLAHLGSCLSALPIIDEIYKKKNLDDIFVLSAGHSGIALYAVLEQLYGHDAEELFIKHGVHPCRDIANHIYLSTGSLGIGLAIATGMAISNPKHDVYVLLSDGECAEGIVWEALRYIGNNKINNIKVYLNVNGYGAYSKIDPNEIIEKVELFLPSVKSRITTEYKAPFLSGLDAHYYVMNDNDWDWVKQNYK